MSVLGLVSKCLMNTEISYAHLCCLQPRAKHQLHVFTLRTEDKEKVQFLEAKTWMVVHS